MTAKLVVGPPALRHNRAPTACDTVPMVPLGMIMFAMATPSSARTPPVSAQIALWSATSDLIMSSHATPYRMLFGDYSTNMSGPALKPSQDLLCSDARAEWKGHIVVAGDWTTPSCSIETRARSLQSVGVTAALFMGTEGLPFTRDASDRSDLRLPSFVLNPKAYGELIDALSKVERNESSFLWFSPADTPLLGSMIFMTIDRFLQIAFLVASLSNAAFAAWRIYLFCDASRDAMTTMTTATLVCSLELLGSILLAVYIIDGPGLEHTRPACMPFIVDRLSLSMYTQLNVLSTLVISMHLRFASVSSPPALCVCTFLNHPCQRTFKLAGGSPRGVGSMIQTSNAVRDLYCPSQRELPLPLL